jgi:hypothetical protein
VKIINEKGKLFGIINVIDLAVLLVLALLVVGGTKRMKAKPITVNEDTKAIVTFEVSDVRMATVENIVVGDPIYHYDKGTLLGTIVETSYEPYKEPVESGDGKWVNAEIPGKYVVSFKVEAEVKDNPDVVVVGGEQTRIGAQFRLKNKRVAVFGTVLGIEVE